MDREGMIKEARGLIKTLRLEPPIDSIIAATKLGMRVGPGDLPKNIYSRTLMSKDSTPWILLRKGASDYPSRFACAMAVGHYILNQGRDKYPYDIQEKDFYEPTLEKFFAEELTMPEEEIGPLNGPASVLTAHFKVPVHLVSERILELGY